MPIRLFVHVSQGIVSLTVVACLLAARALAAPPSTTLDALPPAVSAALRQAAIPQDAVAIVVQAAAGVEGGPAANTLLSLHADRAMNPASTMKLVTTYAALELLGPAFTWKTTISSAAPQVGVALEGDLYLKGSGDPRLLAEGIWLMLRQLRGRGIQVIRGDLVLDRTRFDVAPYDPAAFDGEPFRPYNVGPDALLVNFKSVTLRFMPDPARREVHVAVEPALEGVEVGSVAYADGVCGNWKTRLAADFSHVDRLVFGGAFPGACGEQAWNVAILDHRQYVGALFRSLWSELGGELQGTVRDGIEPADTRVLVDRDSASLSDVIRDINKLSNNVMARQLYLSLAAEILKQPASPEGAERVVRSFYAARGDPMPGLVLENGAGLSRRERIAASSMVRVLQSAWASPVMPEFVSSLPLVGYDGTMKKRLVQRTVAGHAHIKTGTLADARAIAGYVLAASGRMYVVAAFVNHPNAGAAQPALDALLEWIYAEG